MSSPRETSGPQASAEPQTALEALKKVFSGHTSTMFLFFLGVARFIEMTTRHRVDMGAFCRDLCMDWHELSALAADPLLSSLDADERVTPELAAEIQAELRQPSAAGYRIPRVTWHLGRWIRTTDWYPDFQTRLYNRTAACWAGRYVHETVAVRGAVGLGRATDVEELRADDHRRPVRPGCRQVDLRRGRLPGEDRAGRGRAGQVLVLGRTEVDRRPAEPAEVVDERFRQVTHDPVELDHHRIEALVFLDLLVRPIGGGIGDVEAGILLGALVPIAPHSLQLLPFGDLHPLSLW